MILNQKYLKLGTTQNLNMAPTKRDLRVLLLKQKYLKMKFEAERNEVQQQVIMIESPRKRKLKIRSAINKRKAKSYSNIAAMILKKMRKICAEIRDFVGFKKEAIKWK